MSESKKNERYSLWIPEDLRKRVEKLAVSRERIVGISISRAELVRLALSRGIEHLENEDREVVRVARARE